MISPEFAFFAMLLVIHGCYTTFGINSSTDSAHIHLAAAAFVGAPSRSGRRSRRSLPDSDQPENVAASYSRYSSDLQDDSSIAQQQRACRAKAEQNGHAVAAELEFADHAVSGTKRHRSGLNAMLAAAKAGRFKVLYFQCLSRLAREFVITLPMLKELVYVYGVRIISVSEGVDSKDGNWELLAMVRAWMHQEYLKVLRAAVLRGQEDAVLKDYSVGDWPFGYGSEPIPGTEQGRRGRNAKPRMRYTINEEHAAWVRQIFQWFIKDRKSLDWIARELTQRRAPKDHRSTTASWHHVSVKGVLRNSKYIGLWPWGKKSNTRNPLTGDLWQEARPPEEVQKWIRERPQLRLVDDEMYFAAQALLDEFEKKYGGCRSANGRLRGSVAGTAQPRHLLQGLIRCGACRRRFQVSGVNARYLRCSGHVRGECKCKTRLSRELAERKILGVISEELGNDREWKAAVLAFAQAAWTESEVRRPDEQISDENALAELERRIRCLLDEIEQGLANEDLRHRLERRMQEREQLRRRLAERTRRSDEPSGPPTEAWLDAELRNLHSVLVGAMPAAAIALQELIGEVVVTEVALPDKKRRGFRSVIRLHAAGVAKRFNIDVGTGSAALPEIEKEVVFAVLPPWAEIANHVKDGFDRGVSFESIAAEIGCTKKLAAKAFRWWHLSRSLPVPDGRKRRDRLGVETLAIKLSDDVRALMDEGQLLQEIAGRLNCDRNTVTAAIRHWYSSRNLPIPDGRTRRKSLSRKTSNDDAA